MKKIFVSLLLALALTATVQAGTRDLAKPAVRHGITVKDGAFHSTALARDMKYRILLPRGYEDGTRRFPVLYLLHGLYGDYLNWDTLTNLERYAQDRPFITVMPDAGDSWYVNSASTPQDKFEDYISKDLITEIDNKYRTIRSRQARGIAGLSMGGYSAIKFAVKNRDMFVFAASLSGAFDAPLDLDTRRAEFRDQLLKVFGPPGSQTRTDNDVFLQLKKVAASELPFLYLACGADDDFLAINRKLAGTLSAARVRYEYHETPGNHDWGYWDRTIPDVLAKFSEILLQSEPRVVRQK